MGSSIPAVIDYLSTLADTVTSGLDVQVSDGWPSNLGLRMFGVGIDQPPTEPSGDQATGTDAIFTLGNVGLKEGFGVPCYIYDASGGTDQKACRDAAFALFDPFLEALQADPSLGGACLVGMVADVAVTGPRSTDEAAKGRFCIISFSVVCTNLI